MRAVLATVLLCAALTPARADDTLASVSFRQAEDLAKQGKWADACPLYQASYKADPQVGVLLHLADCNERVGNFASAFSEFSDAAEFAHEHGDAKREAIAKKRADALATKVARVHVAAPALAGLVVKRDGSDITLLIASDLPIDPGKHTFEASAPGHKAWSSTVEIAGSGVTNVTIPELAVEAAPPGPPSPAAVVHQGRIKITSAANAEILLDAKKVGVGAYADTVRSGGHSLRIVAPGMRPYQTEILVGDGDDRVIDVPLEPEAPQVAAAGAGGTTSGYAGIAVLVGTSTDGLMSSPGGNGACATPYCGHGPRGLLGLLVAGRARFNVSSHFSFDPEAAFHLRRIYLESCSPCMQTDDVFLYDTELYGYGRVAFTTGLAKLALLVGPYLALRLGALSHFDLTGSMDPARNPNHFDIGGAAALELFVGRWGGQLQFQIGSQHVSEFLDSSTMGVGGALGVRL